MFHNQVEHVQVKIATKRISDTFLYYPLNTESGLFRPQGTAD